MALSSFVKFGLVGIINTAVDVTVFTVLHMTGLSLLLSNILSTSVALCLSFVLNRRYTFPSDHISRNRIALYMIVTLSGLWILAPITIKLLMGLDGLIHYSTPFIALLGHDDVIRTVLPKLGSVAVTLAWNYVWYSQVVFSPRPLRKRNRQP